jgi:hypothetical protein
LWSQFSNALFITKDLPAHPTLSGQQLYLRALLTNKKRQLSALRDAFHKSSQDEPAVLRSSASESSKPLAPMRIEAAVISVPE